MNVFGDCDYKNTKMVVESGPMAGRTFEVEDWARNVMRKGVEWPSDLGNPAVIVFWTEHRELLKSSESDVVEFLRVGITGIYGHIGWAGHILMPDELGIEV